MSLSPQAIAAKGEEIYRTKFKESLEKAHPGKYVAMVVGQFESVPVARASTRSSNPTSSVIVQT